MHANKSGNTSQMEAFETLQQGCAKTQNNKMVEYLTSIGRSKRRILDCNVT